MFGCTTPVLLPSISVFVVEGIFFLVICVNSYSILYCLHLFNASMIFHFFPLFFDVLHTNRLSSKLDIVIWLWSRMKNLKSFLHYWVLCKIKTFPSWRYARSGDLTFVHLQLYIVCGCNLSSTPASPTEDLTMVLELFSTFFFDKNFKLVVYYKIGFRRL